jgi:hypothetical protein
MTRLARMVVSGLPHHVTQRGNRREPIFFEDGDQGDLPRSSWGADAQGGCGSLGLLLDAKPRAPDPESAANGWARPCGGRSTSPLHQLHQCTRPLDGASISEPFRIGSHGRIASDLSGLSPNASAASSPRASAVFTSVAAKAQTISVQFLNGKNGKAIKKGVRIWAYFNNDTGRHILDLHTDQDGEIRFDTNGAKTFQVSLVGYVPCGEQPIGSPAQDYAVADTLRTGLLTRNDCGYMDAEPIRGRLLYS